MEGAPSAKTVRRRILHSGVTRRNHYQLTAKKATGVSATCVMKAKCWITTLATSLKTLQHLSIALALVMVSARSVRQGGIQMEITKNVFHSLLTAKHSMGVHAKNATQDKVY